MQKKDLQSHMIKLHGAPKPHAVRGAGGRWWAFGRELSCAQTWLREWHPLSCLALFSKAGNWSYRAAGNILFLGTGAALIIFLADSSSDQRFAFVRLPHPIRCFGAGGAAAGRAPKEQQQAEGQVVGGGRVCCGCTL